MSTDNRGWSGVSVVLAFAVGALAGAAVTWLMTTPTGQRKRDRAGAAVKSAVERTRLVSADLQAALRRATDAARVAWDEARRESEPPA